MTIKVIIRTRFTNKIGHSFLKYRSGSVRKAKKSSTFPKSGSNHSSSKSFFLPSMPRHYTHNTLLFERIYRQCYISSDVGTVLRLPPTLCSRRWTDGLHQQPLDTPQRLHLVYPPHRRAGDDHRRKEAQNGRDVRPGSPPAASPVRSHPLLQQLCPAGVRLRNTRWKQIYPNGSNS